MTGLVGILRNVPLGQRSITATPSDMSSFYLAARETSGPDNRQLSSAVVLVEDRNGDSAYSYPQMTLMDQGKRLNKGQINQTDDRYRYCNARKAFETYEIDADEERWIFDAASREEEIYQSEVLIPFLILNGETIETY